MRLTWRHALVLIVALSAATAKAEDPPAKPVARYFAISQQAMQANAQHDHLGAIAMGEKALASAEKQFGRESEEAADMHYNLGRFQEAAGAHALAQGRLETALAIYEKVLGGEHVYVSETLSALGRARVNTGDFPGAIRDMTRAVEIRRKLPDQPPAKLADYWFSLAVAHGFAHDYRSAAQAYQASLDISEKLYGRDDVRINLVLSKLGIVANENSEYDKALAYHQRVLANTIKAYGPDDLRTAVPRGNIAAAYHMLGQYHKAEPLLKKSLTLRLQLHGENHRETAIHLNNMAAFYRDAGDYVRALALVKRAVAAYRTNPHISYELGAALINLGSILRSSGRAEEAEVVLRQALAERIKYYGADHPRAAYAMLGLADVLTYLERKPEAEPIYRQALEMLEKSLGGSHPWVADALNGLAQTQADPERLVSYRRALAIFEQVYGPQHPYVAIALSNITAALMVLGDHVGGRDAQARVNDIRERNLELLLDAGSEASKERDLADITRETDDTVTIHLRHLAEDEGAARLAMTTIVQRKGRLLDVMASALGTLRRHLSDEDQQVLEQLSSARSLFAARLLYEPGFEGETQAQVVDELRERIAELESIISERSAAYRAAREPVTLERLSAALPEEAALVEIALYQPIRWRQRGARCASLHYAAYVLKRGEAPKGIDLGASPAIDAQVAALRAALASPASDPRKAARALDAAVMQPIRKLLGGNIRVLLSPDGALNLIPFGALVDEHGRYLVTRYDFTYLGSGRELLRVAASEPARQGVVIVGAPAFGTFTSDALGAKGQKRSRPLSMRLVRFDPLPATQQEVTRLGRLFPSASMLTGPQATESAVKQLHGPRILHIATHGFFLPELTTGAANPCSRAATLVRLAGDELDRNPLLQSGLAFAGANVAARKDEDGVLTALEASSLDLFGTKLVVLSACETGVGEVRNGQGVHGLRRAFAIAGAETQVMSLWKVDDEATRDLMIGYYQALAAGKGRATAMRDVQLAMLSKDETTHPYYWAGFIVSGNDAPLDIADRKQLEVPAVAPTRRGCACQLGDRSPAPSAWWLLLVGAARYGRRRRTQRRGPTAATRSAT